VSATDCWAVGYYSNGSVYQTLVERWDGTAWAVLTSPNTNTTQNDVFLGVTCVSASDCWAVGYYHNGSNYQTLTEQWNGASWAIVTSPNTSTAQDNVLLGVTCVSESDCWAAGEFYNGTAAQTVIERWDGTAWAIVPSANTSATHNNVLYGVTCASASDCWAVGYYNAGGAHTLAEHYTVPVQLVAVASRKVDGSAGTFDVDLPLTGSPGIECRSGGANGDYILVFSFANPLATVAGASVTSGTGSVASSNIGSNDAHNYLVNLTGVTNAQVITVSLANVTDSVGDLSSAVSASMGVLLGDVNGSGRVDAADVSLVRQQTLQPVTMSNFREDINASGRIDAADVSIARQQTLTSLP
jgi:hypothetical protein